MYRALLIAIVVAGCRVSSGYYGVAPQPLAPDNDSSVPYADQLASLIREWRGVQTHKNSRWDIDVVETELHDAYLSACKAANQPDDMWRWDPESGANSFHTMDLDSVYAVFEQVPDGRFAEAMKHIDNARRELRRIELINSRIGCDIETLDTWPYIALEGELIHAHSLLDTAPPADTPWDAKGTVAHIEAALELIDKANLEPQKDRVHHQFWGPGDFSTVDYRLRLIDARDVLDETAKDLEADATPAVRKGPRKQVLAHVHAVLDALNAVIAERTAAPRR
jgi:hypothetical protein